MHRAKANMVVCAKAMLNVARKLEENYGAPFFEGSFWDSRYVGGAARLRARHWRRGPRRANRGLIAREEAKAETALAPWRDKLRGKRVLLFTGGVKSWSVVSALQDLGISRGRDRNLEVDARKTRRAFWN